MRLRKRRGQTVEGIRKRARKGVNGRKMTYLLLTSRKLLLSDRTHQPSPCRRRYWRLCLFKVSFVFHIKLSTPRQRQWNTAAVGVGVEDFIFYKCAFRGPRVTTTQVPLSLGITKVECIITSTMRRPSTKPPPSSFSRPRYRSTTIAP